MSVSSRDLALLDMPLVAEQLPITLANGAYWSHFAGYCEGCDNKLGPGDIVGSVTVHDGRMVIIEAVGVCSPCKLITRYLFRLHDDMRITGLGKNGWQTWTHDTQDNPNLSWHQSAAAKLRRALTNKTRN